MDLNTYRPCVGIMLLNKQGLVFIGRRRSKRNPEHVAPGYEWQMPQGGIDEGENPYDAAIRELAEETGITRASFIAEAPDWYTYELPVDASKKSWKGRFRGQRQKWFALRFEGEENEINIHAPVGGHRPEFDAWRWERMDQLTQLIIPFKRDVYQQVVNAFGHLADKDI